MILDNCRGLMRTVDFSLYDAALGGVTHEVKVIYVHNSSIYYIKCTIHTCSDIDQQLCNLLLVTVYKGPERELIVTAT